MILYLIAVFFLFFLFADSEIIPEKKEEKSISLKHISFVQHTTPQPIQSEPEPILEKSEPEPITERKIHKPKKERKYTTNWVFSLYNAYGRKNAYTLSYTNNDAGLPIVSKWYLFTFVPAITYNFKF
jgi:hypothetical protein